MTTSPGPTRLLGVVFAGGESRRFGSPKALAEYRGKALWLWAAEAVGPISETVVALVNDPRVASAVSLPTRADSGEGPLAGLIEALAWAREEGCDGLAVVACDMPWVPEDAFALLLERWDGQSIVVPKSPGPWGFEPLCGIYPVEGLYPLEGKGHGGTGIQGDEADTSLLARARVSLAEGAKSLGAFVAKENPITVELSMPPKALRSANAPEDLLPFVVSIVGNKNSGKTRATVALIEELSRRGYSVMSAKHGHHFQFDREGSDSWRHRHEGGAQRVLAVSDQEMAVMGSWTPGTSMDLADLVARYLNDADVVIAEGFRTAGVPRIEVYRPSVQPEPAFGPRNEGAGGLLAAVLEGGDEGTAWTVPTFDASDPRTWADLADLLESHL